MNTKNKLAAISIAATMACTSTLGATVAAQEKLLQIATTQFKSFDAHGVNSSLGEARTKIVDVITQLTELREHFEEQGNSHHDFASKAYDTFATKMASGDPVTHMVYRAALTALRNGGLTGLLDQIEKTAHGMVGSLDQLVTSFIAGAEQEAQMSIINMMAENTGANPLVPMVKLQSGAGSLIAQISVAALFLAEAGYIATDKPSLVAQEGSGVASAGHGTTAAA